MARPRPGLPPTAPEAEALSLSGLTLCKYEVVHEK